MKRAALLLLAVLAIGGAVAFAGFRVRQAAASFQRLGRPRGEAQAPERLRDFVPLEVIARRSRVPEPVLEDALRQAGFVVQPQKATPDVPSPPGLLERALRWLRPDGSRPPEPAGPSGPPGPRGPPGPPGAPDSHPPQPPGRPGAPRADGLLDPAAQSPREIARFSGRRPEEAMEVLAEAVRAYHANPQPEQPTRQAAQR